MLYWPGDAAKSILLHENKYSGEDANTVVFFLQQIAVSVDRAGCPGGPDL